MTKNVENKKDSKKSKKYFLIIISLCTVFILFFIFYMSFFYISPDKQLAAIEKSLAIPDSENAAVYYNNFFYDSNNIATINNLSGFARSSRVLPWKSESNPGDSAAIIENQEFFEEFIEISQMPEARFSFNYNSFINDRIANYFRNMTFILSWVAANDLGDGRIDEAINKCITQIRIGYHLNQQPVWIYKQIGVAIEAVGLSSIRDITMYEGITEEQLKRLDTIVSETQNYIIQNKDIEDKIARLLKSTQSKNNPVITKIKTWYINFLTREAEEKRWQNILQRRISTQRACRIMIALRLYQKQYSKWPQTLDEIKTILPQEIFTDEINNSSFVYRLKGDSFVLFSKGPDNEIYDDLKTYSDDIVFWDPSKAQATEKKLSDPNQ